MRLLIHITRSLWWDALQLPFSLLCDESNEKGDTVKLLTILMRSRECENSSAADIFHSIYDVVLNMVFTIRML